MAMPMKIEARPPRMNRMMTTTSRTPVITLFCRSVSMLPDGLRLVLMKPTVSSAGQRLLQLLRPPS